MIHRKGKAEPRKQYHSRDCKANDHVACTSVRRCHCICHAKNTRAVKRHQS